MKIFQSVFMGQLRSNFAKTYVLTAGGGALGLPPNQGNQGKSGKKEKNFEE